MAPLVAVVDDDISVRESLESLIRSVGMAVKLFVSAEELVNSADPCAADCFILDVCLPGMSGIELNRLSDRERLQVAGDLHHGACV